jgi:predicted Zn finger-like uncharacterized protein
MFTTCPECGTVFRIGPAQLRAAEGFVRCGTCAATFNALLSLTDEPPAGAPGPDSPGPAATAAPSFAAAAIPPIVARTPEPPGPVATLPRAPVGPPTPAVTVAEPPAAPPAPPAPLAAPAPAAALTPQAAPVAPSPPAAAAPTTPAPPAVPSRADELPEDAGELAIPDDFGPESWDDTLDLPRPAAQPLRLDDDTGGDEDAPEGLGQIADEPLLDELDDEPEEDEGDTLAGVVEHADWESLLTGLDDEEEEGAEPVYIVEDEPARPAARPAAAPEPAQAALPPAPALPAAAPAAGPARPAPEPAPTARPDELPTLADIPWPPEEDEDGDPLPPLGTLDDALDDDEAAESLPKLGELADDDEPDDDDGPLSTLDESASDDEPLPALDETDDDEPLPALDEAEDERPTGASGPVPLTAAALAAAAAARQPASGAANAQAPAAPEPWADRPAWPPAPEPAPRGRWLYGVGSLLLAVALAAQLVTHQRDELATHPEWGPLVRDVYARLGMDVYPAWDLAAYEVRGSEAVAGRSKAGALDIVARLAVVGDKPAGLPLVRVTLRDRRGDVLGQRVVAATDYLPADAALADPVRPGTLIPVEVSLPDPGVDASGYEVDICLLTRAQGLVCQGEREPFQR